MKLLQGLLYGLVSGLCEFLPISSLGHRNILMYLFGSTYLEPVMDLIVNIAVILALYISTKSVLDQIRREQAIRLRSRKSHLNLSRLRDLQLVRDSIIPMVIFSIIFVYLSGNSINLLTTSIFFLLNGLIVFVPSRMLNGNKDARMMSKFDSILIGSSAGLSVLPGFSRVGCSTSVASMRGADRQKVLDWALLLSIPGIIFSVVMNIIGIFSVSGSIAVFTGFFPYVFAFIGAFIGSYLSIRTMKFMAVKIGFSGFSYYCWGAALFTFLLYLTVV